MHSFLQFPSVEYHQNAAFDAIPYTYPTTKVKPKLIANTFGGSFGTANSTQLEGSVHRAVRPKCGACARPQLCDSRLLHRFRDAPVGLGTGRKHTLPSSNTVSAYNQPLSARLFPNWGRINTRATGADESYQSAQIELSHSFHGGLELHSTYTYAKALADNQGPANNAGFAGETGGSRATSVLDRYADFGNVYGTRRNRWDSTMVYSLPFGRGQAFGTNVSRGADLVVGGWQISNIFLWQSGPFDSPYFPSGEGDPSGTGSGLTSSAAGFDHGHRNQSPDRVLGVGMKPASRTRLN